MEATTTSLADVLIIGGSHAGLSAALTLYRGMHSSVVFDTNMPRNSYSTPVRLTPTWEDQSPETLRESCRKELLSAGFTTFVSSQVKTVRKTSEGKFEVVDGTGNNWLGRKVLLAIGTQDMFPDVPGYSELFVRGIYPCMWQFGFELRGATSAGLLALGSLANVAHAIMLAQDGSKFANTVTIYTNQNPNLARQIEHALDVACITLDDRKIAQLRQDHNGSKGVVIDFCDGTHRDEAFLVHRPTNGINRSIPDQLGVVITNMGFIEAPLPFCKTNVAGVYAAGDCATMMHTINHAATMGSYAACGLSRELS